jgi:hypothetical protein
MKPLRNWMLAAGALAIVTGTCALAATTADAVPQQFRIKAAKQPDGPFVQEIHANVNEGQVKFFTLRPKNISESDLRPELAQPIIPLGFQIKYFRNGNNITADVRDGDGYSFNLRAGKSKRFDVRIKAQISGEACVLTQITDATVAHDAAIITLNSPDACDS